MLLPKDLTLAKVIVGRGTVFLVFLIRIRTPPLFPRFRWCLLTLRDQQRARKGRHRLAVHSRHCIGQGPLCGTQSPREGHGSLWATEDSCKNTSLVYFRCLLDGRATMVAILETGGWGTSHRRTKNVTDSTKQSSFMPPTPHNDDRDAQLKR